MFAQVRTARIEPALVLLQEAKSIFGFAEAARDEEGVARLRAAAEDGAAAMTFSDGGYINKDLVVASGVASRGGAVQFSRSSAETAQEFFKPLSCETSGQSQAQKKATRFGSHGSEVAQRPSEALPANGMCSMPIEEKVNALQEPVARQDDFVIRAWSPDRCVIANGDAQR
jgi:hypothetical protein